MFKQNVYRLNYGIFTLAQLLIYLILLDFYGVNKVVLLFLY